MIRTPKRLPGTKRSFDLALWEESVRDIFGSTADIVLELEIALHKNDPESHRKRLEIILTHWEEMEQIISDELPKTQEVERLMQSMGMPMTLAYLGISPADVRKALIGSRDMRDKYLTSSLLWDMGLLGEMAERIN